MPATRRSAKINLRIKDEKPKKEITSEAVLTASVQTNKREIKKSFSDSEIQAPNENEKEASSDTSDFSSDEEFSKEKFEKHRKSIELRKNQVISKLNLHNDATRFATAMGMKRKVTKPPSTKASKLKKTVRKVQQPSRKSLRIQKIEADDSHATSAPEITPEETRVERFPPDEYAMVAIGFECDKETDPERVAKEWDDYQEFQSSLKDLNGKRSHAKETKYLSTEKYHNKWKHLMGTEPPVVEKVLYKRIAAIQFYPQMDRRLLAVGDVNGTVAVWDLERKDENGGIYLFQTHLRAVRCLKFSPAQPHKLFSSSYDGYLRALDLKKFVFEKAIFDDENSPVMAFDFQDLACNQLICGTYTGDVEILDTRSPNNSPTRIDAHHRSIKCVSVHPAKRHYFASCGLDSQVKIFDCRMLKGSKAKPVVEIGIHSKSVDSAFFSPLSGDKLLTTSLDNHIRIFDTSELTEKSVRLKSSIRHDNHTGRWLSNFRADWHPSREDLIVVGSMARPRQIELLDGDLGLVYVISREEITCVYSLNCFHPQRDILAGGNSSGRVYVLGL